MMLNNFISITFYYSHLCCAFTHHLLCWSMLGKPTLCQPRYGQPKPTQIQHLSNVEILLKAHRNFVYICCDKLVIWDFRWCWTTLSLTFFLFSPLLCIYTSSVMLVNVGETNFMPTPEWPTKANTNTAFVQRRNPT